MRYVIQHHIDEAEHFDLMVETEDSDRLLTWKIAPKEMSLMLDGIAVNSVRIDDHRKIYLDYEGPINKGRGLVKIYDSGECKTVHTGMEIFEFELTGNKLWGVIMLKKMEADAFVVYYIPKMKQN